MGELARGRAAAAALRHEEAWQGRQGNGGHMGGACGRGGQGRAGSLVEAFWEDVRLNALLVQADERGKGQQHARGLQQRPDDAGPARVRVSMRACKDGGGGVVAVGERGDGSGAVVGESGCADEGLHGAPMCLHAGS